MCNDHFLQSPSTEPDVNKRVIFWILKSAFHSMLNVDPDINNRVFLDTRKITLIHWFEVGVSGQI